MENKCCTISGMCDSYKCCHFCKKQCEFACVAYDPNCKYLQEGVIKINNGFINNSIKTIPQNKIEIKKPQIIQNEKPKDSSIELKPVKQVVVTKEIKITKRKLI